MTTCDEVLDMHDKLRYGHYMTTNKAFKVKQGKHEVFYGNEIAAFDQAEQLSRDSISLVILYRLDAKGHYVPLGVFKDGRFDDGVY